MVNSTAEADSPSPVLRRLRLAQLQLVRMAGDGANFRSMAQALRVTQPAITKMAHELELALGARVFERGSGGMRLTTPFGHSVLAHARRALAALDQLADDLPHFRDAGTPALRIGSPAFTAAVLLGGPVAQWLKRTPGARVLMSDGVSHQLIAGLKAGELDCVFGSLDDGAAGEHEEDKAALRFEALYDDHVTFVAHPKTPSLARLTRLGQLQALPWVLPPRASQVWTALRREFTAGGHHLPLGVVETSSIPAIGAILRQAPGVVGALRADAGRYLVRNFGLKALRISPRIALPRVGIVRLRSAETSAALEALLALVRAEVRALLTDAAPTRRAAR
jgi:DNA-binding transcriptional LysR family regulator